MPCTVASLVPFAVKEPRKTGLYPGEFKFESSNGIIPQLVVVKDCVRQQFNEDYKTISVGVPDKVVAASIVNDYIISLELTNAEVGPAFFWVDGEHTLEDFMTKFSDEMEAAIERQTLWFQNLVKAADDIWQQHKQHKFISDLQRHAARFLNYKREWLDDSTDKIVKCGACMTLVSKDAAICFACHAILDEEKYSKFKFANTPATAQPMKG